MVRDEIVFTVNSPGEVSTWLAPTVAALKRLAPDVKATVFILPCLYASGTELDVVRRMPRVEAVVSPRESLRYIVGGRLPARVAPDGPGSRRLFGRRAAPGGVAEQALGLSRGRVHRRGYECAGGLFPGICVPGERPGASAPKRSAQRPDPRHWRLDGRRGEGGKRTKRSAAR